MKLNNVKINYYKSFGEDSNNLQVEDDITVIVGKNESGKSNLLQLLSKIDLLNGISNRDLNKVNKKYRDEKPSIELKFKLDTDEKDRIKNRLEPIVKENIKNNLWEKTCEILDLFSDIYISNEDFDIIWKDLIDETHEIPMSLAKLHSLYNNFRVYLSGIDSFIGFNNMKQYYRYKRKVSEIPKDIQDLNMIVSELYSIFSSLDIDEDLKIKFDNILESRMKEVVVKPVTTSSNILDDIYEKYNSKYEDISNEDVSLKKIDIGLVIGLFKNLGDLRLDFEKINKDTIDNIINKKINNINQELEYTLFVLQEEKRVKIDGAFKIYFKYEKKLKNSINNICNFNQKIVSSIGTTQGIEIYNKYISSLKKLESNIFSTYKDFCKNKQRYSSALNQEEIQSYSDSFLYIEEGIDFIYNFIPTFYLYEEKFLEDKYTYNDEFLKNFNSKNLIYLFFNIIGINSKDLSQIFNDPISGESHDIKNRINKLIEKKIERDFNNFYKQEEIKIELCFNGNTFLPFINSTDNSMNISERSRGLRWYLSMFIDMKANNLSDKNVIYLIDEPAVYLHPNAQRQVLEFLKSLTENQNQLIYATHSPYMIDSNEFQKVRALQKVDGITHIHNKIYNSELSKVSKLETLSPILDAIGLDLRYNLGPSNQMLNIITEGITDYMYISAMANYLDIKGIYILPSVGAPNVDQLACILIGWGLDFKILLDYDNAGNDAAKKLKKLNLEINKDYYFLTGKDEFNRHDDNVVIEDLINKQDINKMGIDEESDKTIKARIFKSKVENKEVVLSRQTVKNFKKVFTMLGVYENQKKEEFVGK